MPRKLIKRIVIIVLAFALSLPAMGACFAQTSFAFGTNGGVSAAIDTRGATILIAATNFFLYTTVLRVSDSQSNTWQYPSAYAAGSNEQVMIYFVTEPKTSATHTFQMAGGGFVNGVVYACSGTLARYPLAAQNGSLTQSLTLQSGSVTPAEAGDLIVAVVGANSGGAYTASVDSGFSTPIISASNNVTAAYLVAPNTAAVNPTWTLGANSNCASAPGCPSTIAVFKAASAGLPTLVAPYITTFMGNGSYGFAGDGATYTAATLGSPGGLCINGAGTIAYEIDLDNNRVRAINLQQTTQTIMGVSVGPLQVQTVAGTGAASFSGDTGSATLATMAHPVYCALDPSGNLYVADQQNNRIREISTAGTITTVAGSGASGGCATGGFSGDGAVATAAVMNCPQGVIFDAAGNMYVADTNNNDVRVVNNQGGNQTLFGQVVCAGCIQTIASGLGGPLGMALDSGNLYIASYFGQLVFKVNSAGTKTVFAGTNGVAGYAGDGGVATSAKLFNPFDVKVSGGFLYIVDTGNSVIRKVNLSTNIISTDAGDYSSLGRGALVSTQGQAGIGGGYMGDAGPKQFASFNYPIFIYFDAAGNYYIADLYNERIRKISGATNGPLTMTGGTLGGGTLK